MDRPEKSGGAYILIENSEQVKFESNEQVEFAGNQVGLGVTVKSRSPVLFVRIVLFG